MQPSRLLSRPFLALVSISIHAALALLQAQDIEVFFIDKGKVHEQTSSSAPGAATGFFYDASLSPRSGGGGVSAASVQRPGGTVDTLNNEDGWFDFENEFASQGELDSNYPNSGTYTFTITGGTDGTKVITLSFQGTDAYPGAPHIQNYSALQSIDPTEQLTLSWAPFPGGTTDDIIQVEIQDAGNIVFEAGGPIGTNTLDGTATSVIVPPNTLPVGKSLQLEIVFSHPVQFQPYDFATFGEEPGGAAAFSTVTALTIQTQSEGSTTDASLIAILKTQSFQQNEAGIPVLVDEEDQDASRFAFEVVVESSSGGAVTAASVTLPGGAVHPLSLNDEDYRLESNFSEKPEMDQSFPTGTYAITVNTVNDGTQNLSLSLPADQYPNIPRVSNWAEAQNLDSAAAFTLNFDPFDGGTTNDFVLLEIHSINTTNNSLAFESPGPGEPGALHGENTFAIIPANSLKPGIDYLANLSFFRIVGNDPRYSTAVIAFHKKTQFRMHTAGGTDTTAPVLVRVEPSRGTSQVQDISAVMFQFSEPMDTSIDFSNALEWVGVPDPLQFSYTWTDNNTRLLCRYTPSLPLNTSIQWTLNPPAASTPFQDIAGNDLVFSPQEGGFSTATTSILGEKDVLWFQAIKAEIFQQSGTTPTPLEEYFFGFDSEWNGFNTVSSVELTPPGGSPITFHPDSHGDGLEIEAEYAEKSDLDTHIPNGTYGIQFNTFHDGTQTIQLALPSDNYPNIPTLQNHAALATVDPTFPLTLTWDPFINPGPNDAIVIFIENDFGRELFETPEAVQVGFIAPSETSFTIPANTLPPGRTFEAEIAFLKASEFDNTSYPGVNGLSAFGRATLFEITTLGDPIRADLDMVSGTPNSFQFRLVGEKRMTYTIESTTDFSKWNFENIFNADSNINGPNGEFLFQHFPQQGSSFKYFRAREGAHFDPAN